MIALENLLSLLPATLLSRLEARYKVDATQQVKWTGSRVFVCLLNHSLLTPRLLEETYPRKTGQTVDHSSFSRCLSKINPAYFRALFEELYARLAPQASKGEAVTLRIRFVDATIVTLSAKLSLRTGIRRRSTANWPRCRWLWCRVCALSSAPKPGNRWC